MNNSVLRIPTPYVVYTGDAKNFAQAKLAYGVYEWTNKIICQLRSDKYESFIDFEGIETVASFEQAASVGAKTLLIGYSPYSADLPELFLETIKDALRAGLNVASGTHGKLNDNAELLALATENNVKLFDFRHHEGALYPKGNGKKRSGLRLLTVGTDCACGKKFTALSIHKHLKDHVPTTFNSTGQTGFLISDSGINVDTINGDFISGASEWLTPDNDPNHWDIIEGQASITHPSFCGTTLSLLRGSQPDIIVMCHDPFRSTQRGVERKIPNIMEEIETNIMMGRIANPNLVLGAVSIFGKDIEEAELDTELNKFRYLNVPVFDPARPNDEFNTFISTLIKMSRAAR